MIVTRLKDDPSVWRKSAEKDSDFEMIAHEAHVYSRLRSNSHVPDLKASNSLSLDIEHIEGQSLNEILDVKYPDRKCTPVEAKNALEYLEKYIDAEEALLYENVLYRDLNLNHLWFQKDKAVFIDLEAATIKEAADNFWKLDSMRGTWETMAPEEFTVGERMTERTATYRVAVIAHLMLSGELPYDRSSRRSRAAQIRRKYPPRISPKLPKKARRVFTVALQNQPARRHSRPRQFFKALNDVIFHEGAK